MTTPQFGTPETGRAYADRPAAFGIAERDGRIALVRVEKPGHAPWLDLPGGALDPGEDAAQAVVREFGEETGLKVRAEDSYAQADQYFVNTDGAAYNNRGTFFRVAVVAEAAELKIEAELPRWSCEVRSKDGRISVGMSSRLRAVGEVLGVGDDE